jgi:signal transduction histidine kinase
MDTSIVVQIGSHAPGSATHDAADAPASRYVADALPSGSDFSASSALHNAQPAEHDEIAHLRARIRELAAEVVHAQESVRRHLAQELHDSAGAELTAARFALAGVETWLPADAPPQCAASLAVANRSLDAVSDATRQTIDELHAPSLETGIVRALSQWTSSFAARTRLRTSFVCAADARLTRLPADAALAVFRVAQEALNNVAKHARASGADVRIETSRDNLTLVIADDGIGLSQASGTTGSRDRQFGVAGMRARCEAFSGELNAAAASGATGAVRGTTIRARFAWDALLAATPSGVRRRTALRL